VSIQLRIVWDGEAPGLEHGRLSLVAFGRSLVELVKAARNIAHDEVARAVGEHRTSTRGTRRSFVDLQLSTYRPGSADFTLDAVPSDLEDVAPLLVKDLAARVVTELFTSLRAESEGRHRNPWVRRYVAHLPKGVAVQRYAVLKDGKEVEAFETRSMPRVKEPPRLAHLVRVHGMVAGVTFGDPLAPSVRIAPFEGRTLYNLPATPEQVEQAVRLRGKPIQAMAMVGHKARLLWIREETAPVGRLSPEQRDAHYFSQWVELLERLAK
jgi:hypothetical protein